jgi:crotonobetainyl-CoA:carnitine CoA-transferase CaiB-like acyl-CoA transferase
VGGGDTAMKKDSMAGSDATVSDAQRNSGEGEASTLPLEGIRVIDFTIAMAGPTCSLLLADFGADVIKVERPGRELTRSWGSHYHGENKEFSGLFLALNRNKRGMSLDLKSPDDLAVVEELIASADVVLENFRPGVADRLGFGYQRALELNPRIIYCSISGFGQDGPLADRPGLDMLLQAYCGHLSVTGEEGRPSVRIGHSAIDLLTGTHAAYGILLALRERERSGVGQLIDTSLYEGAMQLMSHYIAVCTGSGEVPGKSGPFFAFSSPYGVFNARDREFFMGAADNRMFRSLCDLLGRPDLVDDERYKTNGDRLSHREDLHAEIMPVFATKDAEEWVDLLTEVNVPASLVANVAELIEQPQARARDMIVHTGVENVYSAGIPIKLDRTPGAIRRRAPKPGEHNDEVIAELRASRDGLGPRPAAAQ